MLQRMALDFLAIGTITQKMDGKFLGGNIIGGLIRVTGAIPRKMMIMTYQIINQLISFACLQFLH